MRRTNNDRSRSDRCCSACDCERVLVARIAVAAVLRGIRPPGCRQTSFAVASGILTVELGHLQRADTRTRRLLLLSVRQPTSRSNWWLLKTRPRSAAVCPARVPAPDAKEPRDRCQRRRPLLHEPVAGVASPCPWGGPRRAGCCTRRKGTDSRGERVPSGCRRSGRLDRAGCGDGLG